MIDIMTLDYGQPSVMENVIYGNVENTKQASSYCLEKKILRKVKEYYNNHKYLLEEVEEKLFKIKDNDYLTELYNYPADVIVRKLVSLQFLKENLII